MAVKQKKEYLLRITLSLHSPSHCRLTLRRRFWYGLGAKPSAQTPNAIILEIFPLNVSKNVLLRPSVLFSQTFCLKQTFYLSNALAALDRLQTQFVCLSVSE